MAEGWNTEKGEKKKGIEIIYPNLRGRRMKS